MFNELKKPDEEQEKIIQLLLSDEEKNQALAFELFNALNMENSVEEVTLTQKQREKKKDIITKIFPHIKRFMIIIPNERLEVSYSDLDNNKWSDNRIDFANIKTINISLYGNQSNDYSHKIIEILEKSGLDNIENILIPHCNLEEIPICIKKCKNLHGLRLDGNNIKEIPAWISELTQLKNVSIKNNMQIQELPENLFLLPHLELLSTMGTGISQKEKLEHTINNMRREQNLPELTIL